MRKRLKSAGDNESTLTSKPMGSNPESETVGNVDPQNRLWSNNIFKNYYFSLILPFNFSAVSLASTSDSTVNVSSLNDTEVQQIHATLTR